MATEQNILLEIKKAVQFLDADSEVVLFGSRARGTSNIESDWDILILTNKIVDRVLRADFLNSLLEVQLQFSICINLLIRNNHDWEERMNTDIYLNVKEEGVLL